MMKKIRIYDGALITVDGIDFRVSIEPDDDQNPPWENSDVCGQVIMRRASRSFHPCLQHQFEKAPWEIHLGQYHGYRVFYDFAEAVKTAKREGWNCPPWKFRTPGEQADASARSMVRYLKGYLAGSWEYVTVTVEPLDDSGNAIPFLSESVSGIEYGDDPEMHSYAAEEAESLCRYLINSHNGMFSRLPLVQDVIEPDEELGGDCLPDFDDDLTSVAA